MTTPFPPLETLGCRIMVCGPSNSGKSTLAVAVGRKLGVPHVHLDQLYHLPNSDWVQRPREEFVQLHHAAIAEESWVMDGNYAPLMPARLERATGVILLGDNRFANLRRYIARTLFQRDRAGGLEGGKDRLTWFMIRWILFVSQRSVRRYRRDLPAAGRPYVEVRTMRQLNRLYEHWGLVRG